jgi:hypothetical protein
MPSSADPKILQHPTPAVGRDHRRKELLIDQGLYDAALHRQCLTAMGGDLPGGRDDAWTGQPAAPNRVPQRDVAVDTRVADVPHGREASVEGFTCHRGAAQCALRRRLSFQRQNEVVGAGARRVHGIEQMRVAVDEPWHGHRSPQVDDEYVLRRGGTDFVERTDLANPAVFDPETLRGTIGAGADVESISTMSRPRSTGIPMARR